MSALSTFLFANPSFISGVASILDFEGNFVSYNHCATPSDADAVALYADWSAVGDALVEAINKLAVGQREQAL